VCIVEAHFQACVDILVEVFQQETARVVELGADRLVHFLLQLLEGSVDLLSRAALLVNGQDAFLEIHP
jgi:hypothetical protein